MGVFCVDNAGARFNWARIVMREVVTMAKSIEAVITAEGLNAFDNSIRKQLILGESMVKPNGRLVRVS
jgi:hypothetical protein